MPRLSPEDKVAKKTLRKLEQTLRKMGDENSTEWESTFIDDVKTRVAEFGAAFYDLEKGDASESLSKLQGLKVAQINKELKLREKIGMKAARQLVFNKMRRKQRRAEESF